MRSAQLANQGDSSERDMKSESACGARNLIPPFPVSPPGKAGAGGFPPRRDTCRASQNRWHVPCGGSPHKMGLRPPCVSPARLPIPVAE